MSIIYPDSQTIPMGVVLKRSPGVTRWAKWAWTAEAVLPGAGPADWKPLLASGDVTTFHAATVPLTLYVSDTEAYAHELGAQMPSVYVVLRPVQGQAMPLEVFCVTVSPYVAQDYCDSGEEIVERVPMPGGVRDWVRDFVARHHEEEAFVKRRRDKARTDRVDDGVGDPRISQTTDVYRAPRKRVGT